MAVAQSLITWLRSNGGHWHADMDLVVGVYGLGGYASKSISAGASVVSCPFALAITPPSARARLSALLRHKPSTSTQSTELSDHQVMVTYLALHRIASTAQQLDILAHQPYVDALPEPSAMETPLWYSEEERALLAGTNVLGATMDRLRDWRIEWEGAREAFDWVETARLGTASEPHGLTWELYLWASTILSSRAFPSHLIDGDKDNSTPVLFPGVDILNHERGRRVSWLSDAHVPMASAEATEGKLTVVIETAVDAGEQVFNSYGAKSNEELLLGYGFVIPSNPDDVVVLKLALPPARQPTSASSPSRILESAGLSELRHYVRRDGVISGSLLAQLRVLVATEEELDDVAAALAETGSSLQSPVRGGSTAEGCKPLDFISWDNEMNALDQLDAMLDAKLRSISTVIIPAPGSHVQDVRSSVLNSIIDYREGQRSILQAAQAYVARLVEEAEGKAEDEEDIAATSEADSD